MRINVRLRTVATPTWEPRSWVWEGQLGSQGHVLHVGAALLVLEP